MKGTFMIKVQKMGWNSTALSQHPPAAIRWETFLQAAPLPAELCPSKTHSAAQPHTIEHVSCGQPFPTTPEDYIGRDVKHTNLKNSRLHRSKCTNSSWKNRHRHKPHHLVEKMSKSQCKNTSNNWKNKMTPPGPVVLQQQDMNIQMQLKHKTNFKFILWRWESLLKRKQPWNAMT